MKREPNIIAKEILERYVRGECTPQEARLVEKWYNQTRNLDGHFDADIAQKHLGQVWEKIDPSRNQTKVYGFKRVILAAACVAILIGFAVYFMNKYTPAAAIIPEKSASLDVNPVQQTILTLADGSIIKLDSLQVGQQLSQHGIIITKQEDGTLSYQPDDSYVLKDHMEFNSITTPAGKQYTIRLPDNSRVWLNAASTLRFPVQFAGNRREIDLSGEGFFDVESDPSKPFIVNSKNQQTIVKGTKFNINAYPNEPRMTTTLVEGAVLVSIAEDDGAHFKQIQLKPNEQLITQGTNLEKTIVDAKYFAAWKEGKFIYENSPLATVMRQLARWYDVEIIYLNDIDNITFTGSLSKSEEISDVLRKISLTESVHFEIDGRRVMVTR